MIYRPVDAEKPLEQGDIFRSVPSPQFSLANLAIVTTDKESPEEVSWHELVQHNEANSITALIAFESVSAIVISQNCDTTRGRDISLCSLDPLTEYIKNPSSNPKKWNNQLLKHAHNPRYFYLPADSTIGIPAPMSADFRAVLRLNRKDLLDMRTSCRIGQLNDVAGEHFRESLAQFFRRYPVNEWYPLTEKEAGVYAEEKKLEAEDLYEWQKKVKDEQKP